MHRAGQPGPPAALDAHPREHLRDAEQHAADREREEHRGEIEHGGGIALLDGVEDRAVPDIDAVLEADIGDDQDQQPDRKRPRQPVAASAPIAARADPEPRQQIILARLLGLLRRSIPDRVRRPPAAAVRRDRRLRRRRRRSRTFADAFRKRILRSFFADDLAFGGLLRTCIGFGHGPITRREIRRFPAGSVIGDCVSRRRGAVSRVSPAPAATLCSTRESCSIE